MFQDLFQFVMQSVIMSAGATSSLHSKCREVNSLSDFTPKALFRLSYCARSKTQKHIKFFRYLGFGGT